MLKLSWSFLAFILITASLSVHAESKKQAELDIACEKARQVALTPRKKEIYNECLNKFKKSKAICADEANVYNGNRINGAPLFYELPACVKAFEFRKQSANN